MRHDIFLSYSRVDSAFALRLVGDLKQKGIEAWFDQLDIPAGVNWDDEIERALGHAKTVIVLLSSASAQSENVKNEINAALELKKQVVPVVLSKSTVPLIITRLQREDFTGDYDAALRKLAHRLSGGSRTGAFEAISGDTGRMPAAQMTTPRQAAEEPQSLTPVTTEKVAPRSAQPRIMLGLGAAALFAGSIATAMFLIGKPEAAPEVKEPVVVAAAAPEPVEATAQPAPVVAPTPIPTPAPAPAPVIAAVPVPSPKTARATKVDYARATAQAIANGQLHAIDHTVHNFCYLQNPDGSWVRRLYALDECFHSDSCYGNEGESAANCTRMKWAVSPTAEGRPWAELGCPNCREPDPQ